MKTTRLQHFTTLLRSVSMAFTTAAAEALHHLVVAATYDTITIMFADERND